MYEHIYILKYGKAIKYQNVGKADIDGILPKGRYPPCLSMADRALLAGYPRYARFPNSVITVFIDSIALLIGHQPTVVGDRKLTSRVSCRKGPICYE